MKTKSMAKLKCISNTKRLCLFVMLFSLLTTNSLQAQSCQSLFTGLGVISRFSIEDQQALTTLARRQVELSFNFSIPKTQKDLALQHLEEQLQSFIVENNLSSLEKLIFEMEYRALVFRYQGEIDTSGSIKIASEKKQVLEQHSKEQTLIQQRSKRIKDLLEEYRIKDIPNFLLKLADGWGYQSHKSTPEQFKDFKEVYNFALEFEPKLIGIRNSREQTLLHLSASHDLPSKITEFLISKGVDLHAKDDKGNTPLEVATLAHNSLINIKLLIKAGANVNIPNNFGDTPFHTAVRYNKLNIVELFMANKADVKAKNSNDETPLHLMFKDSVLFTKESEKIVELLLQNGAVLNAKDNLGKTPMSVAIENGHKTGIKVLKSYGAKK